MDMQNNKKYFHFLIFLDNIKNTVKLSKQRQILKFCLLQKFDWVLRVYFSCDKLLNNGHGYN